MVSETDEAEFSKRCREAIRESGPKKLASAQYLLSPADQHGRNTFYAFFVFDDQLTSEVR